MQAPPSYNSLSLLDGSCRIVRVVRYTRLPPRVPRSSGLNERGAVARVFLIGFDDGEEGTHACETGEKDAG